MALDNIHLRKLLRILFMEANSRRAALRGDIREEIAREELGGSSGGGDFYGHFWFDAKSYVFGMDEIRSILFIRIFLQHRLCQMKQLVLACGC
jgi:hypothetical protein